MIGRRDRGRRENENRLVVMATSRRGQNRHEILDLHPIGGVVNNGNMSTTILFIARHLSPYARHTVTRSHVIGTRSPIRLPRSVYARVYFFKLINIMYDDSVYWLA